MVATKQTRAASRQRERMDAKVERTFVTAFPTSLNWMAVAWRDNLLVGAAFGHSSARQAELSAARPLNLAHASPSFVNATKSENVPAWITELIDDLQRFADGDPVDFSHVVLDQDHLTPFARKIVAACRRIDWGQTSSYGELAAKCGAPGAARAVGTVMAKNRFPLIVPCHRVLAAGGAIGGYSAPDGLVMKRRLLAAERA